jgi:hypothetical protein
MNKVLVFFLSVLSLQANAAIVILNGLTHVHKAVSGNTVTGKIVLKNTGKKEARVVIYRNDLLLSCNAQMLYEPVNSHARSLGNKLSTNVDEKLLQPEEEYEVSYKITSTEDLEKNGTYYELIMVESADPVTEKIREGVKIGSKVRYAVQVVLDLGEYHAPKIKIDNIQLKKQADLSKTLNILLKNEDVYGGVVFISLEILDSNNNKIKVFDKIRRRSYPNTCIDEDIPIKDLPSGKYEGVIVVDNGQDLVGSNLTIEIE